jgi:hypothetical protein
MGIIALILSVIYTILAAQNTPFPFCTQAQYPVYKCEFSLVIEHGQFT